MAGSQASNLRNSPGFFKTVLILLNVAPCSLRSRRSLQRCRDSAISSYRNGSTHPKSIGSLAKSDLTTLNGDSASFAANVATITPSCAPQVIAVSMKDNPQCSTTFAHLLCLPPTNPSPLELLGCSGSQRFAGPLTIAQRVSKLVGSGWSHLGANSPPAADMPRRLLRAGKASTRPRAAGPRRCQRF
eukprot:scaffold7052_cov254-Pinguiococcus_pyrenoidosus.AAC.125